MCAKVQDEPGTTQRCGAEVKSWKLRVESWILHSSLSHSSLDYGGLAQLARAPALHAGGQRFESVILHTAFVDLTMYDLMIKCFNQKSQITNETIFDILEQAKL